MQCVYTTDDTENHQFKKECTQTEMQYICSVVQCILQVYCGQYSVAAVYTAHAVFHALQFAGYPACTLL